MADECLSAIPDIEGIDYTTKRYLIFVEHIHSVVDRLNKEGRCRYIGLPINLILRIDVKIKNTASIRNNCDVEIFSANIFLHIVTGAVFGRGAASGPCLVSMRQSPDC